MKNNSHFAQSVLNKIEVFKEDFQKILKDNPNLKAIDIRTYISYTINKSSNENLQLNPEVNQKIDSETQYKIEQLIKLRKEIILSQMTSLNAKIQIISSIPEEKQKLKSILEEKHIDLTKLHKICSGDYYIGLNTFDEDITNILNSLTIYNYVDQFLFTKEEIDSYLSYPNQEETFTSNNQEEQDDAR